MEDQALVQSQLPDGTASCPTGLKGALFRWASKSKPVAVLPLFFRASVNQQPPVHQFPVLSTGWTAFLHSAPDGVHRRPYFFLLLTTVISFLYFFGLFFLST